MAIEPFQRLTSNTTTVFFGNNMAQAAFNAANDINGGNHPDPVPRVNVWPSLKKFGNDTTTQPYSPFGGVSNPEYIWNQPTSDGQTVAFAVASGAFVVIPGEILSFGVFLNAFADNAMQAKIELFEFAGGTFGKAFPQPTGLDEFLLVAGEPNTPAEGLTETQPYNWQDIRMYSTRFSAPIATTSSRTFTIVVSFEVTNYLIQPNRPNPAGLQFICDIYSDLDT
ncbi:hypothetical protein [Cytobacillus firmus]|uniref:hypothetical protein n=1 Tax=Cytobacillus firmus TaxID=1399 RepID=UPI00202E2C4F|nr:hypothetical protein [Cytobacillus firmus]URT71578.1 hypothetical protein NAF01_03660 [Cytobacillus firmus]